MVMGDLVASPISHFPNICVRLQPMFRVWWWYLPSICFQFLEFPGLMFRQTPDEDGDRFSKIYPEYFLSFCLIPDVKCFQKSFAGQVPAHDDHMCQDISSRKSNKTGDILLHLAPIVSDISLQVVSLGDNNVLLFPSNTPLYHIPMLLASSVLRCCSWLFVVFVVIID